MSENEIPVEDISRMLDTVSEKIPALMKSIMGTMYSQEAGTAMGKAVGSFYRELMDAGLVGQAAFAGKHYCRDIPAGERHAAWLQVVVHWILG